MHGDDVTGDEVPDESDAVERAAHHFESLLAETELRTGEVQWVRRDRHEVPSSSTTRPSGCDSA